MIEIGVGNLSKYFGVDRIFEGVTFDVRTKDKIGLVGRNGTGKTTLMKILAGQEELSGGQVSRRKGLTIGYLEQMPRYEDNHRVIDVLNEAFKEINDIRSKIEFFEEAVGKKMSDERLNEIILRLTALNEEYEAAGGYNINERLNKVLRGLGITDEMQKRGFNTLSGGEKTRVILGKILLKNPELLLLDEPSNHLDIKSVEWLEEYLRDYSGTIVMVSHDRYFLDKVATRIIELEPDGVQLYNGNYSRYVAEKELRFLQAMKEYENQQRKINKMEEQIKRYRIWGEMRDSEKMYKRAKELEKRLSKVEVIDKPLKDRKSVSFRIDGVTRTGKEVVRVENISKAFGDKKLFADVDMTLFYQDSLCILGENGTGKSTIVKIITGELEPDTGAVRTGSKVKIGYLPQEVSFDREDVSVVDYFSYHYGISISEARRELAKILFTGDDVYKLISTLSGGEKSRLRLGMLMYENVNLLILDEPTNHLDIDSREVLEEDLIGYEGTILFVSHDRYFIEKIATRICEIEGHELKLYNFDYEGYRQEKERLSATAEESKKKQEEKQPSKNKLEYFKRKVEAKAINNRKRELKQLEEWIAITEREVAALEAKLNVTTDGWDMDEYNSLYNSYELSKANLDDLYNELEKYDNMQ